MNKLLTGFEINRTDIFLTSSGFTICNVVVKGVGFPEGKMGERPAGCRLRPGSGIAVSLCIFIRSCVWNQSILARLKPCGIHKRRGLIGNQTSF